MIVVLEHGVIKERGTHNELMQVEDGLYRSLSKLQFEV
jgi:ABC-type multidrug transport system fused ATPase/permease subunit